MLRKKVENVVPLRTSLLYTFHIKYTICFDIILNFYSFTVVKIYTKTLTMLKFGHLTARLLCVKQRETINV